jgi:glutaredoxin
MPLRPYPLVPACPSVRPSVILSIKAKGVLDGLGAKYTVVELDTDPDGKAIRAEMADMVGRTSVPAIWIDSKFVGGYVYGVRFIQR